jgi:hypothetical protein
MHIERMKETIALLRRVHKRQARAKRKFNYRSWGGISEYWQCRTTACAGGEMALHKPFQKQGLRPNSNLNFTPVFAEGHNHNFGETALAKFLGITHAQARMIFVNLDVKLDIWRSDVTAEHVADALQNLLDAHWARKSRRVKS